MQVPLLDLTLQHREIAAETMAAITPVVDEQRFILGPVVDQFEREIEAYLPVKHAVGNASGTDAILLALRAFDCGPGDEVVTSPFTFFATAGAIHNVGARPVFADIQPDTFNLDPAAADAACTAADEGGDARAPVRADGGHDGVPRAGRRARHSRCWKTRRRPSARGSGRRTASGSPPACWATRARSASSPRRTWARSATRG